jgi:4-hydroxy-3-methylbut-2-enyl diphosphate reductase
MLKAKWFEDVAKVGVTGATSTPKWLLERVASKISELTKNKIAP